jgi:hypothetical protein
MTATDITTNNNALRHVPIDAIAIADGHNPRTGARDRAEDARLTHAIATRGFDHPILVRPDPDEMLRVLAGGAALCLPGWAVRETYGNGSPKITYPAPHAALDKAREFLAGAKSAGDVAGRCLVLLALSRHADDTALAPSVRRGSPYAIDAYRFTRAEHAIPWCGEAGDLLDEILIEQLPADVAKAIKDAYDERASRAKEQERLAR